MKYEVSYYCNLNSKTEHDSLLTPLTAKSDIDAICIACKNAALSNKKQMYRYVALTLYRYVPQRCCWKTVINKFKIF